MSYPQFGYTHPSTAQLLVTSQSSSPSATSCCDSVVGVGSGSGTGSPTCATGTSATSGPNSGPGGSSAATTVCSCQYDSRLLGGYSRLASTLPVGGLYSAAYADQGYVSLGADPSAFYSPLNNAYELKDGAAAWSTLAQPATYYPYDPTMAAYPYGAGYGGMDLNAAARRKNATRETTSTLKAWLYEHKKNPYPTKGEKIMLAIITKMTLTQVSTWFANARRRLKKENKMTWEPRNRVDDDDDAKSDNENNGTTSGPCTMASNTVTRDSDNVDGSDVAKRRHGMVTVSDDDCDPDHGEHTRSHCDLTRDSLSMASDSTQPSPPPSLNSPVIQPSPSPSPPSSTSTRQAATTLNSKPRIWSLAHTATCTSPTPGRRPPSPTGPSSGSGLGQIAGQGLGPASTTNAMAAMAAERRLALVNARTWMTASAALGTLGLASQYHSLVNGTSRTTTECPNPSSRSSADVHQVAYPHQQSLLASGVVKSNMFSLQGDRTGHTGEACVSQVELLGTAFRPVSKSTP